MMKNLIVAFLMSIGMISLFSRALGGEDAEEILSKLQKSYDKIQDASAMFTQTVRFGVTKAEQSFSGKVIMKKGNKYRIEMEQQTIVTDGATVWSYNKLNNQVLIDTYKENPRSFSPDKVFADLPSQYTASRVAEETIDGKSYTTLKLTPKVKKTAFTSIKVWIDTDEWIMRRIQVLDGSDNLTTYILTDIVLNAGIKDSRFTYSPPSGVEVIDLR